MQKAVWQEAIEIKAPQEIVKISEKNTGYDIHFVEFELN
jgi:hypothetical protein